MTGIALAAGAVLCAPWRSSARTVARRGFTRGFAIAATAALAVVAALTIAPPTLALHTQRVAAKEIVPYPRKAIADANHSLALNGDAMDPYYIKAAAYARLNDYPDTRATLLQALAREPHNFVSWAISAT